MGLILVLGLGWTQFRVHLCLLQTVVAPIYLKATFTVVNPSEFYYTDGAGDIMVREATMLIHFPLQMGTR